MAKMHPLTLAIRGAGGGGSAKSQPAPVESPDSLRSIAYARILDLVSEGEIYGFADQTHPLRCVYFNETVVENTDGSKNFKNFHIDSRVGTQTQDHISGFGGVESESGVGVELKYGTPWVRDFNNLSINAVRVRLAVPQLSQTNTTNGNVTGALVAYKIELATDGGSFATVIDGSFAGKTTSKYERSHRINLPKATNHWTIRVTRITADSTSGALVNKTTVEGFTEIVDAKFRMPMSAVVGVIVDAEQFNAIPSRAYHLKGRLIKVPSNYDPDARTYTGSWDGTFQVRYSNNPAWVFYDMALNDRYGLGNLLAPSYIDKWALYTIAKYCDEPVPDGFGGMEPRFTANLYLQTQEDALKVMQDMATMFRGIMYNAGGKITAVADMPSDPIYLYQPSNVKDGKFTYAASAKKVRHTVALVSWNDMHDFGRAKVEYVPDEDGIKRYGIQPTDVIAIGCTSRGQALRMGKYILTTERYETNMVSFSVGLDGTVPVPGKVIRIADPIRAGVRNGGRVSAATVNYITVDAMPLVAIGDTITCTYPDGTLASRQVTEIVGNRLTVVPAFDAVPLVESNWQVESATLQTQRYRVLSVKEADDGSGYSIAAIQHIEGKFAYVEQGIKIDTPPIVNMQSSVVASPTGIMLINNDVAGQNATQKIITLAWNPVSVAVAYNVQYRTSGGTWIDGGNTTAPTVDIQGLPPGPFEVQITAVNARSDRSQPAYGGPFGVPENSKPPGYVADINGNIIVVDNRVSQEIVDRQAAVVAAGVAAANDASAKSAAAVATAKTYTDGKATTLQAQADALQAQLNDFTGQADDWSNAKAYPQGDFVKDSGKLYRAKQAVPAGTALTNATYWEQIGNYASAGEAITSAVSMSTSNATAIGVQTTRIDGISARMPAGTGTLATDAGLTAEQTARANADTAEVTLRQALSTKLTGFNDPAGKTLSDLTSGLVYDEKTARSTADASEVTARQALSTKMTGMADPSGATLPSLSSGLLYDERTARSSADASEVTARQSLSATLTGFNDPTGKTLADLTSGLVYSEKTARVSGDGALSSRMDLQDATIAGKASSSALNTLTLQTLQPRPNLLPNPTFLNDLSGWTLENLQHAICAQTNDGTWIAFPPINSASYDIASAVISNVVATQQYTVSAEALKSDNNGLFYIAIIFKNSSGGVVGTEQDLTFNVSDNGSRKSLTVTAPTNAVSMRLAIVAYNTTNWTQVNRIKVETGPNATQFDYSGLLMSQGTRLSTLESSVNDPTTGLVNTRARIVTEETTRANADSAAASRMDTMDVTIAGKASASIVSSMQVYASGGNLQVNSLFSTDIKTWSIAGNSSGATTGFIWSDGHAAGGDTHLYTAQNVKSLRVDQNGSTPGSGNYVEFQSSGYIRVVDIARLYAACRYNALRCNFEIRINWYNAAKTRIAVNGGGQLAPSNLTDPTAAQCPLATVFSDKPAGAEFATIDMVLWNIGQANPYLWIWSPQLNPVPAGSTTPVPYSPGGNEASAQVTLVTDVNGRITGYNIANDGTTGIFEVVADNFKITNPAGGARTEYSTGNWRVYDSAGTLRVQMGVW